MRNLGSLMMLLLAPGCQTSDRPPKVGGHLEVHWAGPQKGTIAGEAKAEWCGPLRSLVVRTVRGDTGFAVALYPAGTLKTGSYRILEPLKADSNPPAARVGLRWLGQNAVQGFQGDSGAVELARSGSGQLSGKVRARARSVSDTQRVRLTGVFEGLSVDSLPRACAGTDTLRKGAVPRPTGIH